MKKKLPVLLASIATIVLVTSCRQKEAASPPKLLPESVKEITIDTVTNHHEDTTHHYEYRTGESGNYQYNYDVVATDAEGNELEGNINVEGKYGKGILTDLQGNTIAITTQWIGYGKLLGTDNEGNEYEVVVK